MPQLMREGMSPTAALQAFRDAGGSVRTQTWYRAWGEVQRDYSERGYWGSADLSQPVSPSELPDWHAGREGSIGFRVGVAVRDQATGLVDTRTHFMFSDEPIAPQDAVDQMIQTYQDNADVTEYGGVLVQAYFIQAYAMRGPR